LEVHGCLQIGFGPDKGLPATLCGGENLGLRGMGDGEVSHGTVIIGANPDGFERDS
jgi:hypothetical protein